MATEQGSTTTEPTIDREESTVEREETNNNSDVTDIEQDEDNMSNSPPTEDYVSADEGSKIYVQKLSFGRDFLIFEKQLKVHFLSQGHWAYVSEGGAITLERGQVEAQVKAKCLRGLFACLDYKVIEKVAHLSDAHAVVKKLKRIFVGTQESLRRELKQKFSSYEFRNDYFLFLNEMENFTLKMAELGEKSFKDNLIVIMDRLPRMHSAFLHALKLEVEKMDNNQDNFDKYFEKMIEYFRDTGLYKTQRKQINKGSTNKGSKKSVYNVNKHKRKMNRKGNMTIKCSVCKKTGHSAKQCWHNEDRDENEPIPDKCTVCDKFGHKASKCWHNQDGDNNSNDPDNSKLSMMAVNNTVERRDTAFLVDSGATQHTCGVKSLFTEIKPHRESISTAKGDIITSHIGTVEIQLESGTMIKLKNTLFWEGAPNLLSTSEIVQKGFSFE